MKKFLVGLALVAAATSSFAATVTNGFGKQEVPDAPKRVVLFDWGSADTLATLGQSHKVVGVAYGAVMPEWLQDAYQHAEKVGSLGSPDFEKVAALKPDLIVVANRAVKHEAQLREIAPVLKVDVSYETPWPSLKQNALNWGLLTNTQEEAKLKVDALDKRLQELKAKYTKLNAKSLAVLVNERKINAYGAKSRFSLVYGDLGTKSVLPGDEVQTDRHGQAITYEFINEKNPDLLFVVDRTAAVTDVKDNAAKTLDNPLVNATNAVKNNGVVYLPPDVMYLYFGGLTSTNQVLRALDKGYEGLKQK